MNWPFGRFGDEVNVRWVAAGFTVSSMVPVTPPRAAEIVVVPGATPRLLKYLCESLSHRGVGFGVWKRGRVVAKSPLVIGPLETAVTVAASHAAGLQTLLANKNILWPAYVQTNADAGELWEAVKSAFAQLIYRESLRDIEACLRSVSQAVA